jgi:pimeloyl-ACP methyl ester carboxylesterase
MRAGTLRIGGGTLETGWWGPGPTEAPTLVLLHEGLGSVALWRDFPARLTASTGWGVFAYSRFGYGNSDTTPLPRPMTYLHDEALVVLPEVLHAAGIQRAVLVGHSDGGSIAAIYAGSVPVLPVPALLPSMLSPIVSWPGLARPPGTCGVRPTKVVGGRHKAGHDEEENPASLTPCPDATGLKPGHDTGDDSTDGGHTGAINFRPTLLGLVTIAAHFVVEDLNIASIRQIQAEYETSGLRQRLVRYHRDVDAAFRGWNDTWLDPRFKDFNITGLLPNIQVPILALQGAGDPYGSDVQLRVLEASVRVPVSTRLIAGAKHSPHLEAGDATLAAITSFITNLPRGSST